MRSRWIHFGYVHAELPLTEKQCAAVEKAAGRYANRRWKFVVAMVFATIALPLGVIVGGTAAARWLLRILPSHSAAGAIGYLGMCALCVFLYLRFVWSSQRRPMRMALRDIGYEICLDCGYWLRELRNDVTQCPECGAAREPMPLPAAGTGE